LQVEMCAVAERALNYMHTGNVAVIATTVMNPLWIGQAIIEDGMPCYNPQMVSIDGSDLARVNRLTWPYDPTTHQPRSSARASQLYVYNDTVAKVRVYILLFPVVPFNPCLRLN
jgi:hypothetical protein